MKTKVAKNITTALMITASLLTAYLFYLVSSPQPTLKMWLYGSLAMLLGITSFVIHKKNSGSQ